MSSIDDLPPALPSMWRALKRGYQAEPMLLWLKFLTMFDLQASRFGGGSEPQESLDVLD